MKGLICSDLYAISLHVSSNILGQIPSQAWSDLTPYLDLGEGTLPNLLSAQCVWICKLPYLRVVFLNLFRFGEPRNLGSSAITKTVDISIRFSTVRIYCHGN